MLKMDTHTYSCIHTNSMECAVIQGLVAAYQFTNFDLFYGTRISNTIN
jgi:hypothetical protein